MKERNQTPVMVIPLFEAAAFCWTFSLGRPTPTMAEGNLKSPVCVCMCERSSRHLTCTLKDEETEAETNRSV